MILSKRYFKFFNLLTVFFIVLNSKGLTASDDQSYNISYYGSILAGQIAKYNNDNELASKFYGFANKKNPDNKNIMDLSIMSLLLSGKVNQAIEKLDANYNEDFTKNSQVSKLLKFIDKVQKEEYSKALKVLEDDSEILITSKIQPLIKAWLANDFDNAEKFINEFNYKTEGLILSDTYFLHLALLNKLYKKEESADSILKKTLKLSKAEKIRHLYFYYNLNKKTAHKKEEFKLFKLENPDHSFSIYLEKNFLDGFKINSKKDGVSEGFFNIAEALYSQRMYETSIAYSYMSLYLNKNNYINYYLISQNFQMLGKTEKAISALLNIPINSYLGWNTYLKLADLNIYLNNYKEAQSYLNKLQDYSPNRADVYYKLGELKHNKKKYEEAIAAFNKSIHLSQKELEKNWYLFYSRGMSYERSKQWKEAEKDFLYALKLSPEQPLVLNYLGYTWVDYGIKLKLAEEFIKKAISLRPKDGYFIDSLGWFYYRQGKYKEAVRELEKAVSLVPNDAIINDHLGDALYRAGYKNEATYQWNRALLYKPEKELKSNIELKLQKGL